MVYSSCLGNRLVDDFMFRYGGKKSELTHQGKRAFRSGNSNAGAEKRLDAYDVLASPGNDNDHLSAGNV